MKWFFALNATSLHGQRDFWEPMMLAAVASAQHHTDLDPHLMWDGDEDPFLDTLRARGVTVIKHRVTFFDALEAHAPAQHVGWLSIASGAFLRTELPLLVEDAVILYTDCDVLFNGPFHAPMHPKVFACAPEFERGNPNEVNTGVMLMNLPALRSTLPEFQQFIRGHLNDFRTFDQDAYRQFYAGQAELLPDTFNWKPYWGVNEDATIVHFHGPKPAWAKRTLAQEDDNNVPIFTELFGRDVPSYVHYVDRWTSMARAAGGQV